MLFKAPSRNDSQSSLGALLHDNLRKALCKRSLVESHESIICTTASAIAIGSLGPELAKSSCATPSPVRMISKSLLIALRWCRASRTLRANEHMSGMT